MLISFYSLSKNIFKVFNETNDLSIIHIHKKETLDIDEITNQFINKARVKKTKFIIYSLLIGTIINY